MSSTTPARRLGLGQQIFLLYAVIVVLVVGAGTTVALVVADRLVDHAARDRVKSLAGAVATMPEVATALETSDPTATLQPLAEQLRRNADVSFVVIFSPEGIRYTHPNPENIGKHFIGTYKPALDGKIVVETFEGTLGPSVRAVVPIYAAGADPAARPIGLVSVGVTVDQVGHALTDALPLLLGAAASAMALAAIASWWVSRRLARQTFGMGAGELAGLYAHHDAVLHGVREGLVVVDRKRRVVLINDAARDLLGVADDLVGHPVSDLPLAGDLAALFESGESVEDRVHLAGERLVVVSQVPVHSPVDGQRRRTDLGTVVTLRDHTQVMSLANELSSTRSLADALRANVHESANRLHTIVMLVEMGDTESAVKLATGEVRAKRMLTSRLVGQFDEPTLVALLLGKADEAARQSVDLVVTSDSRLIGETFAPVDLVTIVGNLADNAIDAALLGAAPHRVEITIRMAESDLLVEVRDSGPGFSDEALTRVFQPGWSTKDADPDRRHGRGIGMAIVQQVVARLGGEIRVTNATGAHNGDLDGGVVTVHLPLDDSEPSLTPPAATN
jgi:two-component system, CitB family, sensor kinase